MREIKFRGLTKSGEWVYGGYLPYYPEKNDELCFISCFKKDIDYGYLEDCNIVIKKTIGQYIGRKDKNNKEIYEGDIVSCFYEGEHSYDSAYKEEILYKYNSFFCGENRIPNDIEVIGNIHENPELLR
jgi:uncharacterized phage protein (TIGR01671 family)